MATRSNLTPPNFFVIGAQKAGTTFLCSHLEKHEKISFSAHKELFFFSKRGLNKRAYAHYLKRYFRPRLVKASATVIVDGTANYYRSPLTIKNLNRFVGGEYKAAMSLRHPVSKALSWYMHSFSRGRLNGTESVLSDYFVEHSLYAEHIERWRGALGPTRFMVLNYELLEDDPTEFVNSTLRFLGLEPLGERSSKRINAGSRIVRRGDALVPVLDAPLAEGQQLPHFPLKELSELQARFREDVLRTQALTGFDLSHWLELPEFKEEQEAEEKSAA